MVSYNCVVGDDDNFFSGMFHKQNEKLLVQNWSSVRNNSNFFYAKSKYKMKSQFLQGRKFILLVIYVKNYIKLVYDQ